MRVTSLAAAALASAILAGANVNSNVVKADVAPEGTTAKAQSAIDNAKANVESAQRDVDQAQQDVDTAKSNLDKAQDDAKAPDAAYDAQKSKTDAAEKNAADKKTAWDAAKKAKDAAQALVDEANDPAKVKKANDDVTAQEGIVKNDQTEKQTADQKVKDQNTQIGKDNTAVSDKTAAYGKAQKAKNDADKAVNDAEDALNGTGIDDAFNNMQTARKQKIITAGKLEQAKKERDDLAKKNPDFEKLSQEIGDSQQVANQKLNDATQQAKSKNTDVKNLKKKLHDLDEKNNDLNKNSLSFSDPDRYKQVFLDYFNNKLTPEDIDFVTAEEARNNQFNDSEKDKQVQINNVNDLTDAQIEDLSLFAAHLINGLRNQLGLPDVTVTKGSIKFAKDVAQKYISDLNAHRWSDGLTITQNGDETDMDTHGWHNIAGINNAAKENGLDYNEDSLEYTDSVQNSTSQRYEDADFGNFFTSPVTMNQLKKVMFNTIKGMVFAADGNGVTSAGGSKEIEFGHAAGILGLEQTGDGIKPAGYEDTLAELKGKVSEDRSNKEDAQGWVDWYQERVGYYNALELQLKEAKEKNNQKEISRIKSILDDEDNKKDYAKARENFAKYNKEVSKADQDLNKTNTAIKKLKENKNAPYIAALPTIYEHLGEPFDSFYGGDHILTVAPTDVKDQSKFDETVIPTYAEQYKEVNTKLQTANKALQKANDLIDFLSKEVNVTNINAKLGEDNTKFKEALNKYKSLSKSHKQLTEDLNVALSNQTRANNAFKQADQELTDAKQKVSDDEQILKDLEKEAEQKAQDLQDAQTRLGQLKQHVEDLKNASQIFVKADAAEKKAHADYDVAKKAADEAAQELAKLAPAKKAADAKVAAAQAAYDEALARLREAKDRLAAAKRALADLEAAQERVDTSKLDNHKSSETTANTKLNEASTKNTKKRVVLTHNAFVYTKSGKAIRSGLHIKFIRRGKTLKTLKVVTINGKKFYQIGRNQYVKVANTRIKTHAVHIKARIKGLKKVKACDRRGKFNKHYVRSKRSYSFNEKAVINGKTYYKITGTNDWILANKLALKK